MISNHIIWKFILIFSRNRYYSIKDIMIIVNFCQSSVQDSRSKLNSQKCSVFESNSQTGYVSWKIQFLSKSKWLWYPYWKNSRIYPKLKNGKGMNKVSLHNNKNLAKWPNYQMTMVSLNKKSDVLKFKIDPSFNCIVKNVFSKVWWSLQKILQFQSRLWRIWGPVLSTTSSNPGYN